MVPEHAQTPFPSKHPRALGRAWVTYFKAEGCRVKGLALQGLKGGSLATGIWLLPSPHHPSLPQFPSATRQLGSASVSLNVLPVGISNSPHLYSSVYCVFPLGLWSGVLSHALCLCPILGLSQVFLPGSASVHPRTSVFLPGLCLRNGLLFSASRHALPCPTHILYI